MLKHPTLDQLYALGLQGMAKGFTEIGAEADNLDKREWLGFCSIARRHGVRIRGSRRDCATPNCGSKPAPKMSIIEARAASIGPCSKSSSRGIGSRPTKTWPWLARPASASHGSLQRLATRPAAIIARCYITASQSSSKQHPALARGDGRHPRLLRVLGRADLLILDDWGLEPLDAGARHDLLEILEERYGRRSTIVTSQLPVDRWHQVVNDPTYADAILDRLVHNAHRIELAGESLRRVRPSREKITDENLTRQQPKRQ